MTTNPTDLAASIARLRALVAEWRANRLVHFDGDDVETACDRIAHELDGALL